MFKGITTALITPFKEDLSIDFSSLEKLLKIQLNSDVDFIIIGGSTGEGNSLQPDEYISFVKTSLEIVSDKKPLIVNVSASNVQNSVNFIQKLNNTSVYGIISTAPYYSLPSQGGILKYFETINNISKKPIMIYDHPKRTGVEISDALVVELSKFTKIKALKDSSLDSSRALRMSYLLKQSKNDLSILSGDDSSFLHFNLYGGHGLVSVISNIFPVFIKNIYLFCKNNDYSRAVDLYTMIFPLLLSMSKSVNPVSIKYLAYLQNIIDSPNVRLPLIEISNSNKKLLESEIKNFISKKNANNFSK